MSLRDIVIMAATYHGRAWLSGPPEARGWSTRVVPYKIMAGLPVEGDRQAMVLVLPQRAMTDAEATELGAALTRAVMEITRENPDADHVSTRPGT